jgi:hypothetical protein
LYLSSSPLRSPASVCLPWSLHTHRWSREDGVLRKDRFQLQRGSHRQTDVSPRVPPLPSRRPRTTASAGHAIQSRAAALAPEGGEPRAGRHAGKRAHRTHTRTKSTRDTSRTPTYIKCSSHAGAPPVPHRGTPHPWPHRLRPSRTPGSDQVVVVEWGSHCILPYMRAPCPGWVFAIK